MSDTALPPGAPPSGLEDLNFESMIKRAADLHFAPAASNADGTPSADLPPAVAMIRKQTPEEFVRQLNKMPLFMTELDETGEDDESSNEALEAIKALQYEGSDLDVAKNFKTQGNECFKGRDFKNARAYYTKALAVKFDDQELELSCINNRAQCNLLMGSFGQLYSHHDRADLPQVITVKRSPTAAPPSPVTQQTTSRGSAPPKPSSSSTSSRKPSRASKTPPPLTPPTLRLKP